jgi:hypothetical protein
MERTKNRNLIFFISVRCRPNHPAAPRHTAQHSDWTAPWGGGGVGGTKALSALMYVRPCPVAF